MELSKIGMQVQISGINLAKNVGILTPEQAKETIKTVQEKEMNRMVENLDKSGAKDVDNLSPENSTNISKNGKAGNKNESGATVSGKTWNIPAALQRCTLSNIGSVILKELGKLVGSSKQEMLPDEKLNKVMEQINIVGSMPKMDPDFTSNTSIKDQIKAHTEAKNFLKENLSLSGATVDFISPPKIKDVTILNHNIDLTKERKLDESVFKYHITGKAEKQDNGKYDYSDGVRKDILKDGFRKEDNVIVYGVASQFNGCEAKRQETVEPKRILETYESDHTQGPQAQLAFPAEQVLVIGCGGKLGFNGLAKVLNEETKAEIGHGYLTPNTGTGCEKVIEQLKSKGDKVEYMCVGNVPIGQNGKPIEGGKPVHQILVSAPAFGVYDNGAASQSQKEQIQYLSALNGYRAQFAQCINLAKQENKPVIFKPTAPGLGVFGNDPKIVAKAFFAAGMEFQNELKSNKVTVELQVFIADVENGGTERGAKVMAKELNLFATPQTLINDFDKIKTNDLKLDKDNVKPENLNSTIATLSQIIRLKYEVEVVAASNGNTELENLTVELNEAGNKLSSLILPLVGDQIDAFKEKNNNLNIEKKKQINDLQNSKEFNIDDYIEWPFNTELEKQEFKERKIDEIVTKGLENEYTSIKQELSALKNIGEIIIHYQKKSDNKDLTDDLNFQKMVAFVK